MFDICQNLTNFDRGGRGYRLITRASAIGKSSFIASFECNSSIFRTSHNRFQWLARNLNYVDFSAKIHKKSEKIVRFYEFWLLARKKTGVEGVALMQ